VRVKVPPGSPNGRRLRVTGRGVQDRAGTPGDLYLVVRPVLPSDPGPEVVALAEQLDALTTADVRENLEL
jgi:DnaJ-class molecular chaperone